MLYSSEVSRSDIVDVDFVVTSTLIIFSEVEADTTLFSLAVGVCLVDLADVSRLGLAYMNFLTLADSGSSP